MNWEEIYENYDLFEKALSWSCIPVNHLLWKDEEMRSRMWIDYCHQYKLAKRHIDKLYGDIGHPSTLYKELKDTNNEL